MDMYRPGEKMMSGRTVILDVQTYGPIQLYTPFIIQRTMGPSGHVRRRREHELRNQGRSQSARQALQPHGPVEL
jgi:hypothetical protein